MNSDFLKLGNIENLKTLSILKKFILSIAGLEEVMVSGIGGVNNPYELFGLNDEGTASVEFVFESLKGLHSDLSSLNLNNLSILPEVKDSVGTAVSEIRNAVNRIYQ